MDGQLSPQRRDVVMATWPRWMREEYAAQVDALLWTGWYTRAQVEALAWHNLQALAAREAPGGACMGVPQAA